MTVNHFFFSHQALTDILFICDEVGRDEVCGIGRVIPDAGDILYLSEIKLLPQDVTSGTVLVQEENLTPFFDSIPEEERKEWCFNWHSHVQMGVSPSSTDTENYRKFSDMFDLFIPAIFNQKQEFNLWSYWSKPLFATLNIENIWLHELKKDYRRYKQMGLTVPKDKTIPFLLWMAEKEGLVMSEDRKDFLREEIKANVVKKWGNGYTYHGGYGGYQNNSASLQQKTTTSTNTGSSQSETEKRDYVTNLNNQNQLISVGTNENKKNQSPPQNSLQTTANELTAIPTKTGKGSTGTKHFHRQMWVEEYETIRDFINSHNIKEDDDGDFFDGTTGEAYTYQELYEMAFKRERPSSNSLGNDVVDWADLDAIDMDILLDDYMEKNGYLWDEKLGLWELKVNVPGLDQAGLPIVLSSWQAIKTYVTELKDMGYTANSTPYVEIKNEGGYKPLTASEKTSMEMYEERELVEFMRGFNYYLNRRDWKFHPLFTEDSQDVPPIPYYEALSMQQRTLAQFAERWSDSIPPEEEKPGKNSLKPHEYRELYKFMESEGYFYEKENKQFWMTDEEGKLIIQVPAVSLYDAIGMYIEYKEVQEEEHESLKHSGEAGIEHSTDGTTDLGITTPLPNTNGSNSGLPDITGGSEDVPVSEHSTDEPGDVLATA